MKKRTCLIFLLAIPICMLLAAFIYQLPPVYSRLEPRLATLKARIQYALNPPEEAIFIPGSSGESAGQNLAHTPSPSPLPPTPTETLPPEVPTHTPTPSLTPTITPTALPEAVILDGVIYVHQHDRWNYCGPANLTMALNFWGWPGDRDDVAAVVKPGIQNPANNFIQQGRWDKNVMPYEMMNFVIDETDYNVVMRYGGDIELVKRFVAGGFPVLVEKGFYTADYTGKVTWMGHYLYTTGYDDVAGEFIVQDVLLEPGQNLRVDYGTYYKDWRAFNYLFMVVYPPEREAEIFEILGPYADPAWANQHALEVAEREINEYRGNDQFFAWFNKGTSLVQLQQYAEAGSAYDQAFAIYAELGDDETQRPYRMMWYQTGPYWAYHYSWRYQDVINLANTTLYETIAEPTLEESIYWRGMAYLELGENDLAAADFRETVRLNPNFGPGWAMLEYMGIGP
jgi:tetratricopeptide (TPR) repeat protein